MSRSRSALSGWQAVLVLMLSQAALGMVTIYPSFSEWMPPLARVIIGLGAIIVHATVFLLQFATLFVLQFTHFHRGRQVVLLLVPLALVFGWMGVAFERGPANQRSRARSPGGDHTALHSYVAEDTFYGEVMVHAFSFETAGALESNPVSTSCSGLHAGYWGWGEVGDFWFYCGDTGVVSRFELRNEGWVLEPWAHDGVGPPEAAMPEYWHEPSGHPDPG